MALRFGALLIAIALFSRAFHAWLGDAGIYMVALVSGVADVDAVNLCLARMAGTELLPTVAAIGIVVAAFSNTIVKAGISWVVGGSAVGRFVLPVFLLAIVAGGGGVYLLHLITGPAGGG